MKLRSALLAGIAWMIAAISAAIVIAMMIVVDRAGRLEAGADLLRSQRVFDDLIEDRASTLRSECHVVANALRLRALVATQDRSRAPVSGGGAELRASLGSELLLLTDGAGTLIVDALDRDAEGFELSANRVIAGALASGDGAGVLISKERPHLAHACRIDPGAQTGAIVAVGRVFDDAVAGMFHTQAGSALVVALDGAQVARSLDAGAVGDLAKLAVTATRQLHEVVADRTYVVVGGAFPGYARPRSCPSASTFMASTSRHG